MIIEMRTYQLKQHAVQPFEERFGAALPARLELSPLAAFWHTEVGVLNQVIHVWPYADLNERGRIRAEAIARGIWPPNTAEFVLDQKSEILLPAPFSPPLEPRKLGGIYEIRRYTLAPGQIPTIIERWSRFIDGRVKLSPLVGVWYTELGALNNWIHIWAYKDEGERQRIRAEAVARGVWPPRGEPPLTFVRQETTLVVPAAFSPLN
ncbi:MAG: NIPSNAP family protein [Alphaproteobacteria bacterium]|nr:NIPSNAP family protein [Alphaproteobacteria bacterium]